MTIVQPAEQALRLPLIPLPALITGICASFSLMMTFVILAWVSGAQEGGSLWPWAGYALTVSGLELLSFSLIAIRVHKHKQAWTMQHRQTINKKFDKVKARHALVQSAG